MVTQLAHTTTFDTAIRDTRVTVVLKTDWPSSLGLSAIFLNKARIPLLHRETSSAVGSFSQRILDAWAPQLTKAG